MPLLPPLTAFRLPGKGSVLDDAFPLVRKSDSANFNFNINVGFALTPWNFNHHLLFITDQQVPSWANHLTVLIVNLQENVGTLQQTVGTLQQTVGNLVQNVGLYSPSIYLYLLSLGEMQVSLHNAGAGMRGCRDAGYMLLNNANQPVHATLVPIPVAEQPDLSQLRRFPGQPKCDVSMNQG